jgi:hypothetical protein
MMTRITPTRKGHSGASNNMMEEYFWIWCAPHVLSKLHRCQPYTRECVTRVYTFIYIYIYIVKYQIVSRMTW